ncbi:hypothetical protein HK097_002707 [Rhizophlyctis rosea]|uniref:histidine kinase n=1 Tax=Rhizophlyctis rosea TaxID=64517 RepID=A0AAD5SRC3_9FUNG|nr:hypothetical protein HK097_002707 [Rhizophlyctis rosea]
MMPGGALPTIAAVYVDFPFVLLSAWMGDTFAASSSMALVALWKAGLSGIGQSWGNCIDVTIDIQFIADQLLLLVLLGTALVFAVVLQDRDRVLKNVEDLMRQQTLRNEEDLAFVLSAKQGAKESRSEQAAMMAFLCHELRNPLHAIANMADFLVEDLSVKGTSRSSQESKVSGAAHLDCLHELTDMSKRELERNPFDYYIFQSPDRAVGANTPPCSRHGSVSVSPYQSSVAIKLSSVYMLTLVTDILDLGSLESAGATTNNALTHLSTLLTASFTCAFDLCHQVGVEFSFKIEEDTPLWVWTDSVRMQQILNNLIGNARKFTRTGGRIWVDVEIENRWWGDRDGGDGPDADEVRIAIKNDIEILPYNDNNDEHAPGDAPGIHDVFESDATMNDVKPESSPSYSSSSSPPSTSLRALSQGHPPSEWVLLKISVHDTGIGISPDDLPKLFRPYALPTGSMTHEYGGAGLGLAITDKIVRLLRGRIEVKTELGLGSVFTVLIPLRVGKGETDVRLAKETLNDQSVHIAGTLDEMAKTTGTVRAARRKIFVDDVIALEPLRLPLAEEILPSMVPPPAQTTSSSHLQSGIPFSLHLPAKRVASRVLPPIPSTAPLNPCILVVDDSQINRSILIRMIKQALKPTQPTIIEAINGSEAVTTVSTFPRFDLIFMDIQMPLLNGFEATKQIREMGCTSPVVVASANQILGNAEAQERMKEVGADEALGKPFLKGQVGDCMKRWGVI